ncbi:MAG: extracellular solute-binding protein [Treponema sp.]|nr:extracellular solute-binding protein [Treponema sp.]
MLKKNIVLVLIALVFIAVSPVWAGGGKDIKGMDITIGNWWADYDTNTFKPANDTDEKTLEWRKKIQKDYGFTIREKNIASWSEMPQLAATSIMAGKPAAQVFVLQPNWAMALKAQNLIYPVTDNGAVNLRKPEPIARGALPVEWNQATLDAFNFGGKSYSFSVGINLTNAQVVFFNKRLFREAGLDPNLPYDLQKNGQWTWERFLQVCKQLTRDINNDGIIDTYALPRDLSTDILDAIVSSNGAQYVTKNARTGKFENATGTPAFLEGLQFAIRLNNEGVMKPRPDNTNWDWYKSEFADGKVAMRIDESYVWGELGDMKDDWGVVLFPKGPKSATQRVFTRENVMVIPASYSKEEVEKILFALQLWYTPVTNDWKSGLYNTFRDSRAVDETVALIRDPKLHIVKNFALVAGLNRGDIAWEMWYHEGDPAQLIEAVSQSWNAIIDDSNF